METEKEDMIEVAKKVADRIEQANKVTEDLVKRQEEMDARRILGGKAEAGATIVEKTQEEKSVESARNMLKGTGYDEMLFPVKK